MGAGLSVLADASKLANLMRAFFSRLVIRAILLYVGWKSFKSLKSECRDDDAQHLVFWFVYSIMEFLEVFADVILFWCPFYYEAKMALVVYLGLFNGARTLYRRYLFNFLSAHEGEIDRGLKEMIESVEKKANDIPRKIMQRFREAIPGIPAPVEGGKDTKEGIPINPDSEAPAGKVVSDHTIDTNGPPGGPTNQEEWKE
mmetsp:Transcript_15526/g.30365  ORF Transcript_15526/g.30365 Transcript_15526/m.30365 type:complete len:200 (-) Transcript_15526:225-824(-)